MNGAGVQCTRTGHSPVAASRKPEYMGGSAHAGYVDILRALILLVKRQWSVWVWDTKGLGEQRSGAVV